MVVGKPYDARRVADAAPRPRGPAMRAIERLREIRARAPKAFDLGCAVLVGMAIAGLFFVGR
jgi:hypothetical protein